MSGKAQGRTIAIIGSSGQVGQPTIKPLLASGIHTSVRPLTRTSKVASGASMLRTAKLQFGPEPLATAAVLSLPARALSRYKNKAFYVPSYRLSQKELLLAVQKITGTADQDWEINYQDVNDALKDCNEKIEQKDATAPFVKFFLTHFRQGSGGDFEGKVNVSEVKKLYEVGFQNEVVDDVLERTVS
ncbi:hypothetical protein F52700_5507 [Fusarium sp. NRRL 52700]|nr:hypothetical protein F52700_5507 [Fusarium sp. NRRL 52700]